MPPQPRGFYLPNIAKDGQPRRLVILRRQGYRKGFTDALIPAIVSGGWGVSEYWFEDIKGKPIYGLPAIIDAQDVKPDAVLRWEEHGCLFSTEPWRNAVNWLYDRDIAPLSVDLGYFDHYNSLMFDRYERDGLSCIRNRWPALSGDPIDWSGVHVQIRDYCERMGREWEACDQRDPVADPGYVAVFPQFSHHLSRLKVKHVNEWLQRVHDVIGATGRRVLFKTSPVMKKDIKFPDGAFVIRHDKLRQEPWLNTLIIYHAAWCVTICSSVTNEWVVLQKPGTCTGRSWFTGLGVFHEPDTWEELAQEPTVDVEARNRWCRWWIERQFHVSETVKHLHFMLDEFRNREEEPLDAGDPEKIDYARIYSHVYEHNPAYHAGSQQVKLAEQILDPLIRHKKVATLLDVGCGPGTLVCRMRKRRLFAHGVDVAAIAGREGEPRWFHVGDARSLAWPDDKFDVVCCLDALEHLHEPHVHAAIEEMKRVSKQWLLIGVGATPGRKDWDLPAGVDRLHLTVKDWPAWLELLRGHGLVLCQGDYQGALENVTLWRLR